jgi:hypothetical protein
LSSAKTKYKTICHIYCNPKKLKCANLFGVLDNYKNIYLRENGIITVVCENGINESGQFVYAYILYKKPEIDPITLLKALRKDRDYLVTSDAQFLNATKMDTSLISNMQALNII